MHKGLSLLHISTHFTFYIVFFLLVVRNLFDFIRSILAYLMSHFPVPVFNSFVPLTSNARTDVGSIDTQHR